MNSITKNSAVTLLVLASMTLGSTAGMAGVATIQSASPAASSKPATLNAREKQIQQADALAQNGREAMSDIAAARQLLSEKHDDEARQYLEQARDLLTKLKSEVTTEKGNTSGLLSIYSQLGINKEVEITEQLKQKLETTHLDVIRGKHKKVVETLKSVDVELQYSFVDLPVAIILGKVESALKSLSEKNSKQASEALAAAETELIHDSIVINAINDNPAG